MAPQVILSRWIRSTRESAFDFLALLSRGQKFCGAVPYVRGVRRQPEAFLNLLDEAFGAAFTMGCMSAESPSVDEFTQIFENPLSCEAPQLRPVLLPNISQNNETSTAGEPKSSARHPARFSLSSHSDCCVYLNPSRASRNADLLSRRVRPTLWKIGHRNSVTR